MGSVGVWPGPRGSSDEMRGAWPPPWCRKLCGGFKALARNRSFLEESLSLARAFSEGASGAARWRPAVAKASQCAGPSHGSARARLAGTPGFSLNPVSPWSRRASKFLGQPKLGARRRSRARTCSRSRPVYASLVRRRALWNPPSLRGSQGHRLHPRTLGQASSGRHLSSVITAVLGARQGRSIPWRVPLCPSSPWSSSQGTMAPPQPLLQVPVKKCSCVQKERR